VTASIRIVLGAMVLTGLFVAVGCGGPTVASGPATLPHVRDTFTYKTLEAPPMSAAERAARTPLAPSPSQPAPRPQPAPRYEPPLPAHDTAWDVAAAPRPWQWIVIHHSASDTGSAAAFDAFHRNVRHWDELGYHFVIGNGTGSGDGLVEVGTRWPKQKWGAHCRVGDDETYNDTGIGICLVGDLDKHRPTSAQLASLAKLVDFLAAKYHIDESHIIGHGTVDDTKCPGRYFPLKDFVAQVHRLRVSRGTLASGSGAGVPAS
jgi:N-acetylmuramoyl-L-alanine amidase